MFKGIAIVGATLFSGLVSAGTTQITECPDLNTFSPSQYHETNTIVPGKLYTNVQIVTAETGAEWALVIGPIKARTLDAVDDVADYILSRASTKGDVAHSEDGDFCMYNSGTSGLYISALPDAQADAIKKAMK